MKDKGLMNFKNRSLTNYGEVILKDVVTNNKSWCISLTNNILMFQFINFKPY